MLVDSVHFVMDGNFLALSRGSILTTDYAASRLRRYDLASLTFLPSVASPCRDIQGIKIWNDTLYYCDYSKDIIGAIPMSDLIPSAGP